MTSEAEQERDADKILRSLDKTMRSACDETQAHRMKNAVIVPTTRWHRLMDLAEKARTHLERQDNG